MGLRRDDIGLSPAQGCAKRNDATSTDEREVSMKQSERWQTTLGELIAALTDEVSGLVVDEKTTYAVVAFILADLFKDAKPLALLGD